MEKLYLVGRGLGAPELLTGRAKDIIGRAARVLSIGRQGDYFARERYIEVNALSELMERLKEIIRGATAVLVSGDCCFFSVSKAIAERFSDKYDIEFINGISSVQYLSAKIGVAYDGAVVCSMHGRDERLVPKVCYNRRVFVLTGGRFKAGDICGMLTGYGLGRVSVTVGERLSYPDERIASGTAEELSGAVFGDLSVMYIENSSCVNPHNPLRDCDFTRGEAPMTKEEVRWLSIMKLAVNPADTVYDIGAGTGSVSVEIGRRAFDGYAWAIEMRDGAIELIRRNIERHGAYNVNVIRGRAPEALEELPKPDKAFIGGSAGNMREILEALISKNPFVRITANAVTLQSLSQILEGYARIGIAEPDVTCVNIAKSRRAGGCDMMCAQNPVYIITGQRPGGERNE